MRVISRLFSEEFGRYNYIHYNCVMLKDTTTVALKLLKSEQDMSDFIAEASMLQYIIRCSQFFLIQL